MKPLKPLAVFVGALALVLTGCGTTKYADTINPAQPFVFPGQAPAGQVAVQPAAQPPAVAGTPAPVLPNGAPIPQVAVNPKDMLPHGGGGGGVLRVGDLIRIAFSDLPPQVALTPVEMRIPEDRKITLPYNITVSAVGKTINQLQEEIRAAYVPSFFRHLTVTIRTEERFYFVGGEVRAPARQPYNAELTVLRAIDSVGGFTDFANRKRIELRRANGQIFKIDWNKATKNPALDLPVYPNDQITVHRRLF